MATDIIRHTYRRTWWSLVVRGILAILIGVFIFMRPLASVAAFALVVAIWILIDGVMEIVAAFETRDALKHWWLLLLAGLISVAFGIAALYYYPVLSLTFAVIWVAWWLLVSGAMAIYAGIQEKGLGHSWGWTVVWGIVSVLAGVYAFLAPPVTLVAIMTLLAVVAIVVGVLRLAAAFKLSSVKATVAHAV
jgi:uncharacterized membrane protein HdeD (DUF308 family)